MRTKSAKPKRNIFKDEDCYSHYDPSVEGYGDAASWSAAFKNCMGFDEAKQRMGSKAQGAFGLLGVLFGDTLPIGWSARTASDQWAEIKKAYYKLTIKYYPEMRDGAWHGDKEKFLDVQGAYIILKNQYERKGVKV